MALGRGGRGDMFGRGSSVVFDGAKIRKIGVGQLFTELEIFPISFFSGLFEQEKSLPQCQIPLLKISNPIFPRLNFKSREHISINIIQIIQYDICSPIIVFVA